MLTPKVTNFGNSGLWTTSSTVLGYAETSPEDTIKTLFSQGGQGFWYDPLDLNTVYQDSVGLTPSVIGTSVGLLLDKAKSLGDSTNILPSDFLNETGWIKTNPSISVSVVENMLRVAKGSVAPTTINKVFTCEPSKLYRLSVKYRNHTGNNVRFYLRNPTGGGPSLPLSQILQTFATVSGSFDSLFVSNSTTHSVVIDSQNAVASSVDIESISIVKLSNSIVPAYQNTVSMRPMLRDSPKRLSFDLIDDKLTTNLPNQLTGCTVATAIPNVGTQIVTNQTIPAVYETSSNHCGLLVVNRPLNSYETEQVTKLFNSRAGV